jgi:hypothetical protein
MENVIFSVKEKMKNQSRSMVDADVVKAVGALSVETKLQDYHRLCFGMNPKTKQHAHDLIGSDRVKIMMERVSKADPFSKLREKVLDFTVKPKGSPFSGMDLEQFERFTKRQWTNYQRNFSASML